MIPTDAHCAQLCVDLYNTPSKFDKILDVAGVYAGVLLQPDHNLICLRGSTTVQDWLRDFEACMIDTHLGGVEEGFHEGIPELWAALTSKVDKDKLLVITGHSLGAARACILGAMFILSGYRVVIVGFGCPRPGDAKLAAIIKSCTTLYKNRDDPVTYVPLALIFPDWPYEHPVAEIKVNCAPAYPDPWGQLADHHSELYARALAVPAIK